MYMKIVTTNPGYLHHCIIIVAFHEHSWRKKMAYAIIINCVTLWVCVTELKLDFMNLTLMRMFIAVFAFLITSLSMYVRVGLPVIIQSAVLHTDKILHIFLRFYIWKLAEHDVSVVEICKCITPFYELCNRLLYSYGGLKLNLGIF